MPEDFEAEPTETPVEEIEEGTPEGEPESQPETENQRHIPYDRFQEVYQDAKSQREMNHQLQMQILSMQQQLMAASRPAAAPRPKADPEVAALVSPIIQEALEPYQQRIQEMQQREQAMWANQEAAAAWDYVQTAVPDLQELAPDIQGYLQSLPAARAQKITSDPDLVIQTAELVRAMKGAGKAVGLQAAKQDLKQRGRSDSGSASPSNFNSKIDWSDPNLDWAAAEAKLEKMRKSSR